MEEERNLIWFKETIVPELNGFKIEYRFYEEGDFGSLNQVVFESELKGGQIDFWGKEWLGIYLWDYKNDMELMNILLEPKEKTEKEKALEKLKTLLQK